MKDKKPSVPYPGIDKLINDKTPQRIAKILGCSLGRLYDIRMGNTAMTVDDLFLLRRGIPGVNLAGIVQEVGERREQLGKLRTQKPPPKSRGRNVRKN